MKTFSPMPNGTQAVRAAVPTFLFHCFRKRSYHLQLEVPVILDKLQAGAI